MCREYIQENSKTWHELDEKREEERREQEKEERLAKARRKKEEFTKNNGRMRRITELLTQLPKDEKEKLEGQMRKKGKI